MGAFSIAVATAETHLFFHRSGYESKVVAASDAATVSLRPGKESDQVRKPKDEYDRIVKELKEKGQILER